MTTLIMAAKETKRSGSFLSSSNLSSIFTQSHSVTILTNMSRDGVVVRALASHQCAPGSLTGPPGPDPGVICGLSLLFVLFLAPRGFTPGTPVFPSPQKPTFSKTNISKFQFDLELSSTLS